MSGAGAEDSARRAIDVVAATVGLVILSPFFLLLAVSIKIASPGDVLHRSIRVGCNGRPFTLYKFRSMHAGAALRGPAITRDNDPRVTSVGRMLRRTKIDELPQLFNVLLGDMSLVGPRPEDPRYVARYSPQQRAILEVRPGITSPASLTYRDEERLLAGDEWEEYYLRRVMPAKLAIDLDYVRRRTLWSDLRVILATVISLHSPGPAS